MRGWEMSRREAAEMEGRRAAMAQPKRSVTGSRSQRGKKEGGGGNFQQPAPGGHAVGAEGQE